MATDIAEFVERTFLAYKDGRYLAAFGPRYVSAVQARSIDQLVSESISTGLMECLEVAFQNTSPLDDEISIFATMECGVLTNKRLFLLDDGHLVGTPISLTDIDTYTTSGVLMIKQCIKLGDGTVINRKVHQALDSEVVTHLVELAKNPNIESPLHLRQKLENFDAFDPNGNLTDESLAEQNIAAARIDRFAKELAPNVEGGVVGVASWRPRRKALEDAAMLWIGRALLGIFGDLFHAETRRIGVFVASSTGDVYLAPVGETSADVLSGYLRAQDIGPMEVAEALHIPHDRVSALDRHSSSVELQLDDGTKLSLRFMRLSFMHKNVNTPRRLLKIQANRAGGFNAVSHAG